MLRLVVEVLLVVRGLPALDRGVGESLRDGLEELVLVFMLLILVDKIFGVPSMIPSKVICPSRSRSNIYINILMYFPAPRDREVTRTKEKDKSAKPDLTS